MKNKYPVFPIVQAFERNKEGMLSFWCPWCNDFHHHGSGTGHRSAHCHNPNSPFNKGGYNLQKIVYKPGK